MTLHAYLPQDRLRALARGESLPDRTNGSALFADISGFTPLTEKLTREFGVRRGIEELAHRINSVYDAMIDEIDRLDGSVVSFAGDAIACWFDESLGDSALRAVLCARALQEVLKEFPDLSVKIAVCTGPVRRFATGDPSIRLIDTLAGATMARLAMAEQQAKPGDIILDRHTTQALGLFDLTRRISESGEEFSLLDHASAGQIQTTGKVDKIHGTILQINPDLLKPWVLPMVYEPNCGQPLPCSSGSQGSITTTIRTRWKNWIRSFPKRNRFSTGMRAPCSN
jgi:class 3 adenylate cyclase